MTSDDVICKAARLIYKGLAPRGRPSADEDYKELLRRYQASDEFRQSVHSVAEGLELRVLDVSQYGIVLSPAEGGLFAMSAADFRAQVNDKDRGVIALIQVAIAATFFPTAESLNDLDRRPPPATLRQIRDRLIGLCRELERRYQAAPTPIMDGLLEGWRAILQKPVLQERAERDGSKGRSRAALSNLDGTIQIVAQRMCEHGCLSEERTSDVPLYIALHRYRIQLRDLASNALFALCQEMTHESAVVHSEAVHVLD